MGLSSQCSLTCTLSHLVSKILNIKITTSCLQGLAREIANAVGGGFSLSRISDAQQFKPLAPPENP